MTFELLLLLLLTAIVIAQDPADKPAADKPADAGDNENNRDGNPKGRNEHKVTLCHRTASAHNPYVMVTVDTSSVNNLPDLNGHGTHTGPVFDPETNVSGDTWGDIIPAFEGFEGLNWNDAGKAFLKRRCKLEKTEEEEKELEQKEEETAKEFTERKQSSLCHDRCAAKAEADEVIRQKKEKEEKEETEEEEQEEEEEEGEKPEEAGEKPEEAGEKAEAGKQKAEAAKENAGKPDEEAAPEDRKRNANADCHKTCVAEAKKLTATVKKEKTAKNVEDVADEEAKKDAKSTIERACTKSKGKAAKCKTTTVALKAPCEKLEETKRALAEVAKRSKIAFKLRGCGEEFTDEDELPQIEEEEPARKRQADEFTGTVSGTVGDEGEFQTEDDLVAVAATLPADELEVLVTTDGDDAIVGEDSSSVSATAFSAVVAILSVVAFA